MFAKILQLLILLFNKCNFPYFNATEAIRCVICIQKPIINALTRNLTNSRFIVVEDETCADC